MSDLISWKYFFSQFANKCKSDYVVYGEVFPSFIFILPEIEQNTWINKHPVRIAIPDGSNALEKIIEALPSVLDVDYSDFSVVSGKNNPTVFLSLERAIVSNEEQAMSDASLSNSDWMTPVNITGKTVNFRNKISYSWRFRGRYNKDTIEFSIEKWKCSDIDSICKIIYDGAPNTSFIPIVKKGREFVVPEIFSERYDLSMKKEVILLRESENNNFLINSIGKLVNIR